MSVVSVRAYTRVRNGHQEQVDAHTRTIGDAQDDDGEIGFGARPPGGPDAGESIIYVARRRDPREPFGPDQILEGGGGYGGPARSFGSSPASRPSAGSSPQSGGSAQPQPGRAARSPINADKQARHGPETQVDPGRGTLRADAEALYREFSGRGTMLQRKKPGDPGAKESFDTGDRIIGTYRHLDGREAPTTREQIIYGRTGAHIVPSRPRGWVE